MADSVDEDTGSADEAAPSVGYEEAGLDGPTMDLVVGIEESVQESVKSNKAQQQPISGEQREPDSARPATLPVQLSLFSNNTLTFGEPDIFGTLSPLSKQVRQICFSAVMDF